MPCKFNDTTRAGFVSLSWCFVVDEIHELRKREKEEGIEPDWEIDSFMKASSARGKRHSLMTDYTMRMLGLEACYIPP